MNKYIFTERGYYYLRKTIRETEKKLKEVTKAKAEAGLGQDGWHDEGFKLGIAEEMMWSKRLGELEQILHNAQVVKPEEQNKRVQVGVGVIIEYENGTANEFIIDGYLIGITDRRISVYSPLGKVLLGAIEGEKRILVIGKEKKEIFVKKIFSPSTAEKRILGGK